MVVKISRGSWHHANYVFPRLFNVYVEKPIVNGVGFISGVTNGLFYFQIPI
jgi:hypothetical protein